VVVGGKLLSTMMLVFLLVVLAFIKCVLAYKIFRSLPLHELRRRARGKDHQAAAIYRVAAYGPTFEGLIYPLGLASAIILVLWTARTGWWQAVVTIFIELALAFWWPRARPGGWLWKFGAWVAPLYAKVFSFIRPVLGPLAKLVPAGVWVPVHAGIYEKEDLLELLDSQSGVVDNRVSDQDLLIASNALRFGDKKVASVMTPRREMRLVAEDEAVGPKLMDELHATGFSRFPVVAGSAKAASPTVIGTLYFKDLLKHDGKGSIKDIARHDAYFINESCDLHDCLAAFSSSKHQLLIVVNNFEEIVGVISLEDVLEQILGAPIGDEFDKYDDLRAVANIEAERERAAHHEADPPKEPEPAAE